MSELHCFRHSKVTRPQPGPNAPSTQTLIIQSVYPRHCLGGGGGVEYTNTIIRVVQRSAFVSTDKLWLSMISFFLERTINRVRTHASPVRTWAANSSNLSNMQVLSGCPVYTCPKSTGSASRGPCRRRHVLKFLSLVWFFVTSMVFPMALQWAINFFSFCSLSYRDTQMIHLWNRFWTAPKSVAYCSG